MHFGRTEEQQALAEAARAFVGELPKAETMAEHGDAYDADAWARVVDEQGWPAILVPEDAGGWGFGLVEMGVIFEETGRALVPSPLFGTVALAINALRTNASPDQQTRWLGALASGATGTAHLGSGITATREGDGWHLSGRAERVVDGDSADVVVLRTDQGLFVVDGDRLTRTRMPSLDTTRPLATLDVRVGLGDDARLPGTDVASIRRQAAVLLAAEDAGAAEAVLDLSVDYATVRQQYGQPIGRFQAMQHKMADMLVRSASARSASWYAAWAVETDAPDAAVAARTAAATAADAFFHNAGDAIQIHGGIGFTWEHPCHLYFKRARANQGLLGSPAAHRRAVANAVIDGGEASWT